jgi:Ca2+-binding RTX toxin-like protein
LLDVTAVVKAWQADPAANFGLVILPTGSDAVDVFSSEAVAKAAPVLRVTVDGKNPAPIIGTDGDDDLTGGDRNDMISAGLGDDAASGGADVLELGKDVFADFAGAMAAAKQLGTDTLFAIDDETSLTLKGIELTSLA